MNTIERLEELAILANEEIRLDLAGVQVDIPESAFKPDMLGTYGYGNSPLENAIKSFLKKQCGFKNAICHYHYLTPEGIAGRLEIVLDHRKRYFTTFRVCLSPDLNDWFTSICRGKIDPITIEFRQTHSQTSIDDIVDVLELDIVRA